MKIQILGTGCPKCKSLFANAEEAVRAAGVEAQVEKIENIADIIQFGVMTTPALAIDGQVKSTGKLLDVEAIRKLIQGGGCAG
jgi:small redox-active disulfide protein 2